MGMRESDDSRIAVVISRAPVPLLGYAGRPQLHHTERHIGTYEHVSVSTGTYLYIHIPGI